MANAMFLPGMLKIMDGTIDFGADDLRVLFVSSSYTFDNTDEFVGDLTGILTGTGTVRVTLGSLTTTQDDPNDQVEFDAADAVFTSIDAGTAAALILYKFITNDAASPLIAYYDSLSPGFPIVTDGTTVTIAWHADGILTFKSGAG